jgi:hypothetical protein
MSSRLSYHRKNQKKNRETIIGIFSGRSRFAKTKKSEEASAAAAETSTTSTSRPTTSTSRPTTSTARPTTSTARPMSRSTSRPPTPRQTSPQPLSPHVIISDRPPSPSQTTPASTSRKRRKTTTGIAEIGDDGKFSNFFEILRNISNI